LSHAQDHLLRNPGARAIIIYEKNKDLLASKRKTSCQKGRKTGGSPFPEKKLNPQKKKRIPSQNQEAKKTPKIDKKGGRQESYRKELHNRGGEGNKVRGLLTGNTAEESHRLAITQEKKRKGNFGLGLGLRGPTD